MGLKKQQQVVEMATNDLHTKDQCILHKILSKNDFHQKCFFLTQKCGKELVQENLQESSWMVPNWVACGTPVKMWGESQCWTILH